MRKYSRAVLYGAVLCVISSVFMLTSGGLDTPVAAAQDNAWQRAMYDNDEIFNQLSSGARFRLEARFGIKGPQVPSPSDQGAPLPVEGPVAAPANVLVNNPAADATLQDTQSETAVVLGAGSNIVSAYNDSGSFIGANKFTGFSLSTDAGTSFTDKGALPTSADGDAGDPVLARSSLTGTVFLATLAFVNEEKLMIFRSMDNGATFLLPVNGAPGFVPGVDSQDKEWIAVDNFPGVCQGNVYMAWRNFSTSAAKNGITFTRSTNDGVTWGPSPGTFIAPGGQGAYVTVGKDHAVNVFWYDSSVSPRRIVLRRSTDCGVTFGSTITVAPLLGTGINGDLALNGGFRSNSFPQAAVNPVSGNVYVVYNDRTAGVDKADVFFRQSTDGGVTWGAQVRVNDDATTNDQFFPAIAVTPDGTSLFVPYYDRRNDPANSLISRSAAIATITGATVTFQPNIPITDTSFPVVIGQDPVINPTYMGDYDMAAADNSFFYTTWGDNRLAHLTHAKQPDVRFAKIPVGAAPPPAVVCDMQLNKTTFVTGDAVIAQVLRIANPGTVEVPVELKIWFVVPGLAPLTFVNIGADGSVKLPPGFTTNAGPLTLFTFTAAFPHGPYEFDCRMLQPATGGLQAEDLNPFTFP